VATITNPETPIPLARAAFLIGTVQRPVTPHSLRRAARRLKVLVRDSDGRDAISPAVARKFAETFAATGFLSPRGSRALNDDAAEAA